MAVDEDAALQQALLLSTTDSAPCAQDLRPWSIPGKHGLVTGNIPDNQEEIGAFDREFP